MTNPVNITIILMAILFGGIRPFLDSHPVSGAGTYEALAHLFVGGLFGAWIADFNQQMGLLTGRETTGNKKLYLWLAVGLSLLELVCFLSKR